MRKRRVRRKEKIRGRRSRRVRGKGGEELRGKKTLTGKRKQAIKKREK